MFKNYIKIAWRSLWKNKAFTFLNIIGLSVAFGVAILLSIAAFFELSYDDFHEHADSVYKVYQREQGPDGPQSTEVHVMPFTPALKEGVPGIHRISRYLDDETLLFYKDKELGVDINWVDPDFFSMFSFPILKGNSKTPLKEVNAIVITQKMASVIFGDINAIGKTVNFSLNGKKQPFTVSAVLKDIPANSSIEFDIIGNFKGNPRYETLKDRWDHSNHEVYIQLQEGISISSFEKSTRAFTNLRFKDKIDSAKRDGALPDNNGQYVQLHLLPFKDVYFSSYQNGRAIVSKGLPYIILGIAALLLFIACVNFINMSIAKSTTRLQEIGMRKSLGAAKKHVFLQFWGESMLVFLCTLSCGVALSILLFDSFTSLFSTDASFSNTLSTGIIVVFLLLFIIVTLVAGGYPAFLLSKLGTLQALKGKVQVNGRNKTRDILMIIQFAIVILLVSGTFVLQGQLQYMQNKDLGFNKEQVISLPLNGKRDSRQVVQLLRETLKNESNVISITASDNNLGIGKDGNQSSSGLGFDYKDREVGTHMLVVDYDYLETLDIELLYGRSFGRNFASDSSAVVINEAMTRELQETNPLGKQMEIMDDLPKYTIVGVMKDYHFRDLDEEIEPMTLFMIDQKRFDYAYIKITPMHVASTFSTIQETWQKLEPNSEFLGSFLDENVDRTFRKEKIMMTIITSGAIIAIILSCIGLLAISLLVVNQRTKEIGVRKVVGASVTSLTVLLAKDFVKLVFIAFLIIVPISWWLASNWLENYTYRMDLTIWIFVAAGVMAIFIALATISIGTIKAATANPVKSLRTE
ncbi:ABC transporter permease [Aquimarina sp. 2304DJ70-9]|uniref:ABC transporter permease n=1 Tax=Aquimarina penaris TaxID=3231044 RepID=UPI003462473E